MHTDRLSRLHDLFTDSRALVCASMLMAVLVVGSHTAQRSQVVYISEEGGSRAVLSSQQLQVLLGVVGPDRDQHHHQRLGFQRELVGHFEGGQ